MSLILVNILYIAVSTLASIDFTVILVRAYANTAMSTLGSLLHHCRTEDMPRTNYPVSALDDYPSDTFQ